MASCSLLKVWASRKVDFHDRVQAVFATEIWNIEFSAFSPVSGAPWWSWERRTGQGRRLLIWSLSKRQIKTVKTTKILWVCLLWMLACINIQCTAKLKSSKGLMLIHFLRTTLWSECTAKAQGCLDVLPAPASRFASLCSAPPTQSRCLYLRRRRALGSF